MHLIGKEKEQKSPFFYNTVGGKEGCRALLYLTIKEKGRDRE